MVARIAAEWFERHERRIRRIAYFHHYLRGAEEREEATAECVAYVWRWALRKSASGVLRAMGDYDLRLLVGKMTRLYRAGTRFAGCPWPRMRMESLDAERNAPGRPSARRCRLADGAASPRCARPDEVTRVKMDLALFASRLPPRKRKILAEFMADPRGASRRAARRLGLSQIRIEQLVTEMRPLLAYMGYGPKTRATARGLKRLGLHTTCNRAAMVKWYLRAG
jgi:hypothetical protein